MFCDREEIRRQDPARVRVLPAGQDLEAVKPTGAKVEEGLEIRNYSLILDRRLHISELYDHVPLSMAASEIACDTRHKLITTY